MFCVWLNTAMFKSQSTAGGEGDVEVEGYIEDEVDDIDEDHGTRRGVPMNYMILVWCTGEGKVLKITICSS